MYNIYCSRCKKYTENQNPKVWCPWNWWINFPAVYDSKDEKFINKQDAALIQIKLVLKAP